VIARSAVLSGAWTQRKLIEELSKEFEADKVKA
jgi:hypothetical protein